MNWCTGKTRVAILISMLMLVNCDAQTEGEALPTDEFIRAQIEAAFAATTDLPTTLDVAVHAGQVQISGSLACEECGGRETPGDLDTIQQSLGAIVRAVPGVVGVDFLLSPAP